MDGDHYWCSNKDCSRKMHIYLVPNSIRFIYQVIINECKYFINYYFCFWNGKNVTDYQITKESFYDPIVRFNNIYFDPFLPDDILEGKMQAMLLLK
jgi:hypothetical protein